MNPLANDVVRDAAFEKFRELSDVLTALSGEGDQDDWPYQVMFRINIAERSEARPEELSVIGTVSSLVSAHYGQAWRMVPRVDADNSAVTLTVTIPHPWQRSDVFDTVQLVVDLAYGGRVDLDVQGEPIQPVLEDPRRVAGVD